MNDLFDLISLGGHVHPEAWATIGHVESAWMPPPDEEWPRPPGWWGPWLPPNARHRHGFGPLPDPWSWGRTAQLSIIGLTRRIADAAAAVHAQGGDPGGFIRAVLDDGWGIEGRPPQISLPKGWWHGVYPPDEPRPIGPDLHAVFAAAGFSFLALSRQIEVPALSEALEEAGRRSIEVATARS